ncbi:hypothetical protein V2J09_003018 [Rumex salicifolius]
MDLKLNAVVFLAVLSLLTGVNSQSFLKLPSDNSRSSHKISIGGRKLIRMKTTDDPYCESWKFTVENNDAGAWMTPSRCVQFVKHYITGKRYLSDSEFVAADSFAFAKNVTIAADGKDCWIFDIDETLLSNAPYYAVHGYGLDLKLIAKFESRSEAYNSTAFDEWTELGVAPVLPASLSLYNKLQHLNFTIILLTGRSETYRNITVKNLHLAGYTKWHKLLLRGSSDEGTTAIVYKSKKRMELVAKGYRIHGSSGDQWSDLFGNATAVRSFKLPNPMYFIILSAIFLSIFSGGVASGRKLHDHRSYSAYCESWKSSVEMNDAGKWATVPGQCEQFVKNYMTGHRYLSDSIIVAKEAFSFAENVAIVGDGFDCWIFDVDETLLSNLPYYAEHRYGSERFNETKFDTWTNKAEAAALPQSLILYNNLLRLNFTIFLLTGRTESSRDVTVKNLLFAGYKKWHSLILRGESDEGKPALVYKSSKRKELEEEGYRIHGNSGDQWSDLFGNATAVRSFKLPNPMYYIP